MALQFLQHHLWKTVLSPLNELFQHFWQKVINDVHVVLGSLSYSMDLCVHPFANTMHPDHTSNTCTAKTFFKTKKGLPGGGKGSTPPMQKIP